MTAPTESDFLLAPIVDHGVTVTRTPVTVTTHNMTGEKEFKDLSTENITVVFENANTKYDLLRAGQTKGADARMFFKQDQSMAKSDKILHDSKTYRIGTISTRRFNGNAIYKTALLYLI